MDNCSLALTHSLSTDLPAYFPQTVPGRKTAQEQRLDVLIRSIYLASTRTMFYIFIKYK